MKLKERYRREDGHCAVKIPKISMTRAWKIRSLSALLVVTFAVLLVVGFPFVSRWYQRIGSVEITGDRWSQIGSFEGDIQQITAHFYRTSGRTDILLRVDHAVNGEWIQGEEIPLGLTEQTTMQLPEAGEYTLYAKWPDDKLFVRRAWIELTAS